MNTEDPTGWRYRCPHGHVDVKARVQIEEGSVMRGSVAKTKYYCRTCANRYSGGRQNPHYDRLLDAKTGELV